MNDLISVIIPAYNVAPYIKRSLDSVINQTYKNLEIIIIDDGSNDETPVICDEYAKLDSRVSVIHKKNEGQAIARNVGLDKAKGEWIAFLDSDDWIAHEMYEVLLKSALCNNADISTCKTVMCTLENPIPIVKDSGKVSVLSSEGMIQGLESQAIVRFEVWNKLWKKSLIGDIRFVGKQLYEEITFDKLTFIKAERMACIDRTLHYYRVGRPGNTADGFKMDMIKAIGDYIAFINELKINNYSIETIKAITRSSLRFTINTYIGACRGKVGFDARQSICKYFDSVYLIAKGVGIHSVNMEIFNISPKLYFYISNLLRVIRNV